MVHKPGSVNLLLNLMIINLEQMLPSVSKAAYPNNFTGNKLLFLFGLAPKRVCTAIIVTNYAVSSYLTFSTLPHQRGGIFSVALSLGSPPPEVIWFHFPVEPGLSS